MVSDCEQPHMFINIDKLEIPKNVTSISMYFQSCHPHTFIHPDNNNRYPKCMLFIRIEFAWSEFNWERVMR